MSVSSSCFGVLLLESGIVTMMKLSASHLKSYPATQLASSRGRLVGGFLAGAWRGSPPTPAISEDALVEIAKLLFSSGAGALAWHRIRGSALRSSPVGDQFHHAYRLDTLQAALHQRSLMKIIPLLRRVNVEPLLVKGWAIARLYPELGLRPYVDIDLCILPDQYAAASAVLKSPEAEGCNVDLHLGFGKFYDRRTDDVFARSQLVRLGGMDVRVLSAEDDLRFLCLHLLRHGAVRPLWLCDISVLLETRTGDFDWDRCLSGSRREADWVACAIGLAAKLLGVNIEDTPIARRAHNPPSWLVPAVLAEWGTPFQSRGVVAARLRYPMRLSRELLRHWPNPIEATMTLRGPFNQIPRLPFQVGHVLARTTALLSQLFRELGGAIQHRS